VVDTQKMPIDDALASGSDLSFAVADMVEAMSNFERQMGATISVVATTSLDSILDKPDDKGILTSGR